MEAMWSRFKNIGRPKIPMKEGRASLTGWKAGLQNISQWTTISNIFSNLQKNMAKAGAVVVAAPVTYTDIVNIKIEVTMIYQI